jgi:hypothetical protein
LKTCGENPTKPAAGESTLPVAVFARLVGVDASWVRRLIREQKLPAVEIDGRWHVRPREAQEWIASHCPRIGPRAKTRAHSPRPRRPQARPPTAPPMNGNGHTLAVDGDPDHHVARLHQVLNGLSEALHGGDFDARACGSIKQLSGELRLLERHRLEMLRVKGKFIERADHERIVGTIGRIVADHVHAAAATSAHAAIAALTEAGVELSSPQDALRVLLHHAETTACELRQRIADAVEGLEV